MIVGGVVELTVIVCVQVARLLAASMAPYMRNTVYRSGQLWLVVVSPMKTTLTEPQLSEAVTEAGSGAGTAAAQDTTRDVGQRMTGD